MSVPAITLTGTLQDIFGSADSGCFIVFTLCGYGSSLPRINGTSLLAKTAPIPVACPAGTFSVFLWGNDVITPSGTFYQVTLLDDQENVIQTAAYQFTGSGTLDLSTQAPYLPPSALPFSPNAVVTNPAGGATQTIAGGLNINGNVTITGNLTVTGATSFGGQVTVPFSSTPVFNAAQGSVFKITLTGNVTSSTLINAIASQLIVFDIVQDGTGGRTFVWPTNVVNAAAVNSAANGKTVQAFVYILSDAVAYPMGPATYN